MNFRIQANNPKYVNILDPYDKTVSHAIETVFPLLTEDVFLKLNYSYYPLNYKVDIAYMIEDILIMLKRLREELVGDMTIAWATNTFACVWEMKWDMNSIDLISKWREEEIYDHDWLRIIHSIKLLKTDFMREWKKLLEIIFTALNDCGYAEILLDYQALEKEYLSIDRYGVLYE